MAIQLNLGTLIVDIVANTAIFEKNLNKADKQLIAFGRRFEKIGAGLKTAGLKMSLAITAPFAIFSGYAIKSLADFDDAMTSSTLLIENLSDTMKGKLRQTALDMSKQWAFAADDTARGFFYLFSAGMDAEQALAALPGVLQFARAGAFDLSQAVDLSTDVLTAMGMESKDVGIQQQNLTRITDVLSRAQSVANATTEQFSQALTNQAAASARGLGIELEEVTALLAALAQQGQKGQRAGMRLSMFFNQITEAYRSNSDVWDKLGVKLYNTDGSIRKMADVIEDLENAMRPLNTQLRDNTLSLMGFQTRSKHVVRMLLGMSGAVRHYEAELRKAEGSTNRMANKAMESLSKQFKKTWTSIRIFLMNMAGEFEPSIRRALESIRKFADRLDALPSEVKITIVLAMGSLAMLGPLLWILGAMSNTVGALVRGYTMLGATMTWMGSNAAKAYGFLAKLTSGLISFAKSGMMTTVILAGVQSTFMKALSLIPVALGWVWKAAKGVVKFLWKALKGVIAPALVVAAAIYAIYAAFRNLLQFLPEIGEFWRSVVKFSTDFYNDSIAPITKYAGMVIDKFKAIFSFVSDYISILWKAPKASFAIFDELISHHMRLATLRLTDFFANVSDLAIAGWNKFTSLATDAFTNILTDIDYFSKRISLVWEGIKSPSLFATDGYKKSVLEAKRAWSAATAHALNLQRENKKPFTFKWNPVLDTDATRREYKRHAEKMEELSEKLGIELGILDAEPKLYKAIDNVLSNQLAVNEDTRATAREYEFRMYSASSYWEEAMKAVNKKEEKDDLHDILKAHASTEESSKQATDMLKVSAGTSTGTSSTDAPNKADIEKRLAEEQARRENNLTALTKSLTDAGFTLNSAVKDYSLEGLRSAERLKVMQQMFTDLNDIPMKDYTPKEESRFQPVPDKLTPDKFSLNIEKNTAEQAALQRLMNKGIQDIVFTLVKGGASFFF